MATITPSHLIGVIPYPKSRAATPSWADKSGASAVPGTVASGLDFAGSFQIWTGETGHVYVHTVYDLLTCPEMPACTYLLVRRGENGEQDILKVGRVENTAASLNLAEIRRRGARLGADEVHLHLLASSATRRSEIVVDLAASLLDTHRQVSRVAAQNGCAH